jgi:hypothetical protein
VSTDTVALPPEAWAWIDQLVRFHGTDRATELNRIIVEWCEAGKPEVLKGSVPDTLIAETNEAQVIALRAMLWTCGRVVFPLGAPRSTPRA